MADITLEVGGGYFIYKVVLLSSMKIKFLW